MIDLTCFPIEAEFSEDMIFCTSETVTSLILFTPMMGRMCLLILEIHATICSLCTDVVGPALLFCATFTAITSKALTWLSILLAIPGTICCALAYPIYGRTYQRREREVESLLDAKREEICTICEKGHRLTHAELS